jgi:hypothetical protein
MWFCLQYNLFYCRALALDKAIGRNVGYINHIYLLTNVYLHDLPAPPLFEV